MSNNDGFMNYEELAERLEEESFSIKTNTKKHPKKKKKSWVKSKGTQNEKPQYNKKGNRKRI